MGPLVLITGRSGTGKSRVRDELITRGFAAYGTDEDEISAWIDNDSGQMVVAPPRDIWQTPEWQSAHTWVMQKDRLDAVASSHPDTAVFICGVAANESDVLGLFTVVICLAVHDEEVIRTRIEGRIGNEFGKAPHELEALLAVHRSGPPCEGLGGTVIDGSQPITVVVEEVLAAVKDLL